MRTNKKQSRKAADPKTRTGPIDLADVYTDSFLDYLESVLADEAIMGLELQAKADEVIRRARLGVLRRAPRRSS